MDKPTVQIKPSNQVEAYIMAQITLATEEIKELETALKLAKEERARLENALEYSVEDAYNN